MTSTASYRRELRKLPPTAWPDYLGYCWSVGVAALPTEGFAPLERWAASDDPDVRWVVRENLKKARLARADAAATEALRRRVDEASPPDRMVP